MNPLLTLPASLLKVGKAMRKRKRQNSTKDSPVEETTGDLLNSGCLKLEKSLGVSGNKGLLAPFIESGETDSPELTSAKGGVIAETLVLRGKPATNSRLETMPVEITQQILSHLDDYDDLINTIVASRVVYFIFKGARLRVQKQVTLNSINPEVLNAALATFNIRRDRLPAQYEGPRLRPTAGREFIRAIRPYILEHIRNHISGTVTFPFPTAPSEMSELYHLYKTVRTVAARFVTKSLFYSDGVFETQNLLPAGSGTPLTMEETVSLERSLLQYELMARAIGQPIGEQWPLLSRRGYRSLLTSMNPVEFQQIVTVDAWMLSEYRQWNREFQQGFIDEIVEAGKQANPLSRPGEPEPTNKTKSGVKLRMINARMAMQAADVEQTMPYLCRRPAWQRGRWESDRLLARLQSLGLRFFMNMCKKSPAERNQMMLYAHKHLEYLDTDFLGSGASYYAMRLGTVPRVWCNYMKLDHGPFPNTFVEQLVMTLDHDPQLMKDEARRFLLQTGWWFWGDARLKAMGFEGLAVLNDDIIETERRSRLAGWAYHHHRARHSRPVLPRQRISKDVELPLGEWKKIVLKYQKAGTQLPDFFLADDYLVMAKRMWA